MTLTLTLITTFFVVISYYFGRHVGRIQGAFRLAQEMHGQAFQVILRNPGISEARINELADSLIRSSGDMQEQAVEHIRRAAQEATGLREQS